MANVDIVVRTISDNKGLQQTSTGLESLAKTVVQTAAAITILAVAAGKAFQTLKEGAHLYYLMGKFHTLSPYL